MSVLESRKAKGHSAWTRPLLHGRFTGTLVFPEAKSANERIGFVASAATRGKLFQVVDVATAEHDILGLEGCDQARDHVRDILAPFLLAVPVQSATADIVLVGCFPVGKVAQLHGLDNAAHNHRRTETGSQAEEEHLPTLVAAQCLHGCIVDNLDRATECGVIIEPDPATTQIVGLRYRPVMEHHPRIAHRHHVVLPPLSQHLDSADHLFGGERWPGRKLPMIPLPSGEYLDMRSTHIDNQHFHEPSPSDQNTRRIVSCALISWRFRLTRATHEWRSSRGSDCAHSPASCLSHSGGCDQ